MDINRLDKLSRDFAKRLLRLFPEWKDCARSDRRLGSTKDHLVVEVPPPDGADLSSPLLIRTDDDEVTVAFDHYHSHFNWPPDTEGEIFADPLAFIRAVVNEEQAAVSAWDGENWKGSWLVKRGGDPAPEWPIRQKRISRIRIRSWKGTLNRDYPVQPSTNVY